MRIFGGSSVSCFFGKAYPANPGNSEDGSWERGFRLGFNFFREKSNAIACISEHHHLSPPIFQLLCRPLSFSFSAVKFRRPVSWPRLYKLPKGAQHNKVASVTPCLTQRTPIIPRAWQHCDDPAKDERKIPQMHDVRDPSRRYLSHAY